MIWTGIVVGLFTLFHLAHFTFGWVKGVETSPGVVQNYLELQDEKGRHDVYSMVVAGFTEPALAVLYIVAQLRALRAPHARSAELLPDARPQGSRTRGE